MGCLPHMTRLALGRSPYEPLQAQEHGEGSKGSGSSSTHCVQEFNEKGYPLNKISDLRASRLRKAMNDVLAKVGVCYDTRSGPDHQGTQVIKHLIAADDSTRIEAVNVENEAGVTIDTAEAGLSVFAGLCFLGLRQRIQAFRFYSGVPMVEIIRKEWKHFGPWHFMLASVPATVMTLSLQLSTIFRECKTWDLKYSKSFKLITDIADKLLQVATFTLITELEVFAALQRLGLLPSWPPAPSLISLIPFRASSPIQLLPSFFSPGGGPRALRSLMFSPLLLFWVIFHGKSQVNRWLYEYIRLALPRPTNPDNYSFRGALRFEGTDVLIPEFESDPHEEFCSGRLLAQVRKDLSASVEKIWKLLGSLMDLRRKYDLGNERPSNPQEAVAAPPQNPDATHDSELAGFTISEEPLTVPLQNGDAILEESIDDRATFASSEEPPTVRPQNPDAIPISQFQPSSSLPAVFAVESQSVPIFGEGEPSLLDSVPPRFVDGEAIFTNNGYHSGSSEAINQDQNHHQFRGIPNLPPQDPPPQTSRPLSTQSPEAPPPDVISPEDLGTEVLAPASDLTIEQLESVRESVRETRPEIPAKTSTPHHRITALSLHLAEALGTHLSAHLANILFLPIEALFIRTVAFNFLNSSIFLSVSFSPRNAVMAASLAGEVYPRWTWFGDGMMSGWKGVTGYIARMTICQALDMAVGYSVWQVGAAVVWWLRPT